MPNVRTRNVSKQIAEELRQLDDICAKARPADFELCSGLSAAYRKFDQLHHYAEVLLETTQKLAARRSGDLRAERENMCEQSTADALFYSVIDSRFVSDSRYKPEAEHVGIKVFRRREAEYLQALRRRGALAACEAKSALAGSRYRASYSAVSDDLLNLDLLDAIEANGGKEIGMDLEPLTNSQALAALEERKARMALRFNELANHTPDYCYTECAPVEAENGLDIAQLAANKQTAAKLRLLFQLATFCDKLRKQATVFEEGHQSKEVALRLAQDRLEQHRIFYDYLKDYRSIPPLKPRK